MASNYALYIFEREGKNIVESDEGFATYKYVGAYCYIEDIYVRPEFRKSGIAASFADQIAEKARSNGYTKLLGSVDCKANGADKSLKVLQAYGFSLLNVDGNMIYLEKGI